MFAKGLAFCMGRLLRSCSVDCRCATPASSIGVSGTWGTGIRAGAHGLSETSSRKTCLVSSGKSSSRSDCAGLATDAEEASLVEGSHRTDSDGLVLARMRPSTTIFDAWEALEGSRKGESENRECVVFTNASPLAGGAPAVGLAMMLLTADERKLSLERSLVVSAGIDTGMDDVEDAAGCDIC